MTVRHSCLCATFLVLAVASFSACRAFTYAPAVKEGDERIASVRSAWFALDVYFVSAQLKSNSKAEMTGLKPYPITSLVFDVGQVVTVLKDDRRPEATMFLLEAMSYQIGDSALAELVSSILKNRRPLAAAVATEMLALPKTPCIEAMEANPELLVAEPEAYCVKFDRWRVFLESWRKTQ